MSGEKIIFPKGRQIVLGVSGGIAAYKACDLLRRLQDTGFLIRVIPTQSSLNFVGRATWEALSGQPALSTVWENPAEVSHLSAADTADLIVIAPATADTMAKLAQGRADDLLTTTVLASNAPVLVVPAMHPNMWLNSATIHNVEILRSRGFTVMDPEVGRLSGKDFGVGRFPETAKIVNEVLSLSKAELFLEGKRVLVTAGGTREEIDPVRYIGNKSSGRQGLAIAYEALRSGAEVTVIAGHTDPFELEGVEVIKVNTALEMMSAVEGEFHKNDALVMTAAVADARPTSSAATKIKKSELETINLTANPDILGKFAESKRSNQVIVGFAAETERDLIQAGLEKLISKGADLLYVNDVSGGAIFGQNETSGSLIGLGIEPIEFNNVSKHEVAKTIVIQMAKKLEKVNG
ncbi:MAG: bifunctional phosphopantothenoylcysteine decarboxylase/phosphopantothenate--cysteine ligase CoaBC [Actinobacteria bacterium]|nr:bifunctional phosphopantothenoylcysteine decarboxylase/phosphopantothenate--cysteine ligase CoaBC [Actinomycetota bacterium]